MTIGCTGLTIFDLLEAGLIQVGDEWHHKGRSPKQSVVVGIITESGGLRVGAREYDNPSGAAKAIAGTECNGWKYWRYERDGVWQLVEELRLELHARQLRRRVPV